MGCPLPCVHQVLQHQCEPPSPLPTTCPPAPPAPQIPLHVFSYKDLYGWTMDEIVVQIGTRSNCTFCGVFRRQVGGVGGWVAVASSGD